MSERTLFAVYGASGFGREVMPLVRSMLQARGPTARDSELVFIDDGQGGAPVNGHRVLTYEQFRATDAAGKYVSVAIAAHGTRRTLSEKCMRDGIDSFEIRAPNAVLLDHIEIGPGAILCPFVTITANVRIGRAFHANIYSYIAHDCVIGDYVTFAPGVKCNGNVVVEDGAYLGTGCILRQGKPGSPLTIGEGAVVGMGAVVTKNVASHTTVVGNPARLLDRAST